MNLDPIKFFSVCQAAFIQKVPLEIKIYTVTVSALLGLADYMAGVFVHGSKKFVIGGTETKIFLATYLVLSTGAGFFAQHQIDKK
jgi:hypothetical protein